MSEANVWTVSITFSEEDDRTRADADLQGAAVRLSGYGTSRRNPIDPNLPAIGEGIAAARALGDLSHHLLEHATHEIESWEGHPVKLHPCSAPRSARTPRSSRPPATRPTRRSPPPK